MSGANPRALVEVQSGDREARPDDPGEVVQGAFPGRPAYDLDEHRRDDQEGPDFTSTLVLTRRVWKPGTAEPSTVTPRV